MFEFAQVGKLEQRVDKVVVLNGRVHVLVDGGWQVVGTADSIRTLYEVADREAEHITESEPEPEPVAGVTVITEASVDNFPNATRWVIVPSTGVLHIINEEVVESIAAYHAGVWQQVYKESERS